MIELTLEDQIQHFVKEFLVVKESQIIRFFMDYWGKEHVRYVLNGELYSQALHRHGDGLISPAKRLPMPLSSYSNIISALDVLCSIPSHRIRWFALENFPQELCFLTDEDELFDVAFFDDNNWVAKYPLIPRQRRVTIPEGIEDPVIHIAALYDESLIPKIEPLEFSRFALLAPGGWIKEMIGYEE